MKLPLQMIFRIWLLLIFSIAGGAVCPQSARNVSFGFQGYYGSFLTTQPKAEYLRDSYSRFAELYFEKQTSGNSTWELTHKLPQWGVSFLFGNTGSKQYIGNMAALYAYINLPLIKTRIYKFSFRFGAGPGWAQKPYNIYTNPKNTLIGTRLNAYINMMFRNEFSLGPRLNFNAGLGFTHLSNGGTELPNLGLNTPCITSGLRYNFGKELSAKKFDIPPFIKKIYYRISLSAGMKQAQWVGGKYDLISVLNGSVTKQFGFNHGYGGGMILFYNPFSQQNNSATVPNEIATTTIHAGVYGFYEHFFGKLSVPFQFGVYLNHLKNSSLLFQQIGFRYQISKHLNTELYLKTHLGKAEFIHAGVGYIL